MLVGYNKSRTVRMLRDIRLVGLDYGELYFVGSNPGRRTVERCFITLNLF